MKRIISTLLTLALASVAFFGGFSYINAEYLPDSVYVFEGEDFSCAKGLLTIRSNEKTVSEAPATAGGSYSGKLCLFDVIPLKTVRVSTIERQSLVPSGRAFGVKLFTDGVVVVGFGDVTTAKKTCCPAKDSGIMLGDVIKTIDGRKISGNAELSSIVTASDGKKLEVVLTRNGEEKTVYITPANAKDRTGFKIGMWVRDSSAGIGTLTYINQNTGVAAGLGHGITDSDVEIVLPVLRGELVCVTITAVTKGQVGQPGELKGVFHNESPFASLKINGETGVFGDIQQGSLGADEVLCGDAIPIALKQEVTTGAAQILSTVDGKEPKYYDVEIERVNLSENTLTQNLVVKITDEELLEKTGGIVQGMSGSPIIQQGRLVGAITHVFVSEPTKGYGIFIENMLCCEGKTSSEENNLLAA